ASAAVFCPSSPSVMLSPNARNDVTDSFGGSCTTTLNVQLAVRALASLVVQVTVVVPTVNDAALTGRQLVVNGGCPPVIVGAANETTCADPSSDSTGAGVTGQAIVGAS